MISPEDFFRTIDEKEGVRKEGALLRFAEKIIKKHFSEFIPVYDLKGVLGDASIPDKDKPYAIRDVSEGILQRVYFFNEKTDIYSLMKQGVKHPVVKELVNAIKEYDCDILVFPVYKAGNWVAHGIGMSDEAVKSPRIVIPGDGVSITIQDLKTFCKEHI